MNQTLQICESFLPTLLNTSWNSKIPVIVYLFDTVAKLNCTKEGIVPKDIVKKRKKDLGLQMVQN